MTTITQENIKTELDFIKSSSYQEIVAKIINTNLDWLTQINNENSIDQIIEIRKSLLLKIDKMCKDAYYENNLKALTITHKLLAKIYDRYFIVEKNVANIFEISPLVYEIHNWIEKYMLDYEEKQVDQGVFNDCPKNGKDYVKWMRKLINTHPSKTHPLYKKYMADQSTTEDLRYYMIQESTLDPRFDDILALIQVGTSGQEKMEIAKNYWDEMGNGDPKSVHSYLFAYAIDELGITKEEIDERVSLEALICGNISTSLCLYRHNYYKSIGYFGVTEYLVPFRFNHILKAWKRNNLSDQGVVYHKLHTTIDVEHANDWFNGVIDPVVDRHFENAIDITRGVVYRLNSSKRYLDSMAKHFGVSV